MINSNDVQNLAKKLEDKINETIENWLSEQDIETVGTPDYDVVFETEEDEDEASKWVALHFHIKLSEEVEEEVAASSEVEDDDEQ